MQLVTLLSTEEVIAPAGVHAPVPIARSKAPRRPPLPFLRRRRDLRSRLRALVFRLIHRHALVRPHTSH